MIAGEGSRCPIHGAAGLVEGVEGARNHPPAAELAILRRKTPRPAITSVDRVFLGAASRVLLRV
jgi:hypothetical protein